MTKLLQLFLLVLIVCTAHGAAAHGFASPSGNINCYVHGYSYLQRDEQEMVCLIFEADWEIPRTPEDDACDMDQMRLIYLPRDAAAGAVWTCHSDLFWPYPLPEISYGSEWAYDGFTCSMARDGVRCDYSSGHGFAVNRGRIVLD